MGVWQRGYDDAGDSATSTPIPVVARDGNTNGLFDAGDAITFYARNLRDRVGAQSIENRYAYNNVYWVTWTGAPAAVPDTVAGAIAAPSPAIPASFQDTLHLEQNLRLLASPNNTVGAPRENVEYVFWTDGFAPDQFSTSLPIVDPDTTQSFRIRARYQGRQPSSGSSLHRLTITFQ